ncbi:MAG: F0F1 ATP synthase subunit delta [Buchnera aphidicola (Eriosoma harunire)]
MSYFINIARPYATAIFNIALLDNSIDIWHQELKLCTHISHILFNIQKIPNNLHYTDIIKMFFYITQNEISQKTKNLIKIMAKHQRINYFSDILNYFYILKKNYENFITIEITSAYTLEKKILTSIHQIFSQHFKKKINFKFKIDKTLISGLIIKSDDHVIDYSIKNILNKLTTILNY